MSLSSLILLIMVGAIVVAPFLLAFQITRLAHSQFRNELWLIRDGLVDDIRRRELGNSQAARSLLELVEAHIRIAGKHTLEDCLLAAAIFKPANFEPLENQILGPEVPTLDRTRLIEYLNRLRTATLRHLNWSSVAGWVLVPVFRFTSVGVAVGRPRVVARAMSARILRKRVERAELQVIPKVVTSGRSRHGLDSESALVDTTC
jgi:hypothetical protein